MSEQSKWTASGDCVWGPFDGEAHQLIAQCFDGDDKGNARLIAAAPSLLEEHEACRLQSAAIAKAKEGK